MENLTKSGYSINFPPELKNLVEDSIENANSNREYLYNLFEIKEFDTIHASYFSNREDFVNHIKNLSDGLEPPKFASGCFYNNEIQVLVDTTNNFNMKRKIYTLKHETIHLFFNYFYNKYNLERISWFDESFACYLDGHNCLLPNNYIENKVKFLKNYEKFDINQLKFLKNDEINIYDIYYLIGKYIFENHLETEILTILKTNQKQIANQSITIINQALNYLDKKEKTF